MERLRIFLVVLTLLATLGPGRAASPSSNITGGQQKKPPAAIAAGSFDPHFAGIFSGLASRGRAIQVSIVLMCVALFILIKKLAEAAPVRGPSSVAKNHPPDPKCRTSSSDLNQASTTDN
jgi:hypothetical protein